MLAIAYHNLGTEEEACKNLEGAAQSYFKAFRVAEEHLSHLPQLIDKFRVSYDQVKDVTKRDLPLISIENNEKKSKEQPAPKSRQQLTQ